MIDRKALLADLIKQVKAVEVDLGKQVKAVTEVGERLRAEYDQARKLGRTAATWNAWLDERVTQVAVAWVLGTVFVRFCEDNRLIPEPYLTGAEPERLALAEARYAQYVEDDEDPTFRGWLERAFRDLGAGQAGKLLFEERHNPLFQIPVSHDGARALVEFWRERDEAGESLVHDFTDPLSADGTEGWDTRFLGDLYQDLSEAARKTYALLQTPEFVEEFILDRTMDPVVRELGGRFGELKMIDPTCGSGHFVLGAFRRMVRLWTERQPGRDAHERVRDALNSVHGVDINPFAVAIARFRLLVAAMAASGVRTLAEASRYDWPIHLAVGDSLIKARQLELTLGGEEAGDPLAEFSYATEDVHEYPGILEQGRYDVVVGNPPYITVKDKTLNALYRELYASCSGKYALSVPFAERFFQLAKVGEPDGRGYGMVGQITANSFMKREFGAKLIEEYFAHKIELTEVIDTSGTYIPGHGTPTVILVGRRRSGNNRTGKIRTVRSIQGEPSAPIDPADGLVWKAIVNQIDQPGSLSSWVSVDDLERERYFGKQPWVLTDGGLELVEQIEEHKVMRLRQTLALDIGFGGITAEDDAFFFPSASSARRRQIERTIPMVTGDTVRDYCITPEIASIWPYDTQFEAVHSDAIPATMRAMWPNRRTLQRRKRFGRFIDTIPTIKWYEYGELYREKLRTPHSITFGFVATHNHFALDRGEKVFKQSAPLIKLPQSASERDHLSFLGLLNSSTSCFWLKMMSHDKGSQGVNEGFKSQDWERFYEFTGTKLQQFPIPPVHPTALSVTMDALAQELAAATPHALATPQTPTSTALRTARTKWLSIRAQMIALQEELDWQVYSLYNLHPEDLRAPESEVPELALGERAFEIVLARRVEKGEASDEWFKRHGSTPITTLPNHWSEAYKATVQKRIDAIESSRAIGMVERPEYKRRWATEGWEALQDKALRSWLLDRIENRDLWFQDGQPTLLTRHQLTAELSLDEDFVSVAELYEPRKELATVVEDLLANEHVPFLPALRYKPAGLKKRADWEHVWDLQRQEDAAPDEPAKRKIRDSIPVPPKYTSADFLKPSYWRARGKLDVPKERFISYATGAISGTPDLFGWAGWDHREQAQALSTYFTNHDGLSTEEITPLLAGLLELQPWLTQWHDEFDPLYGGSPAAFFAGYRATKQGEHGLSDDDLRTWRPAPATRRGRRPANS
ncbi:BREX-2 system adenine-specific DNA-methyltransferase PglX [Streptomyces sp. NBC_00258]|uniref:BREX-2 system adenine-specific DNA-methyltransferase PglX n=1 Tax=Streptomyces sp. NBC_00258 TaxID=2903642 RepID=UPI002E2B566F|nr:BREX-2 system adenine-specific DNA-methyltransferase PglX [Streptomyces sp. NBC_00258]